MSARHCRFCGCTENNACVNDADGACWWVADDACSHCVEASMTLASAMQIARQRPMDYVTFPFAVANQLDKMMTWAAGDNAEPHSCFICDRPFIAGEMVLQDVSEGLGHRECFGEDREAFVKNVDTGEPLGPDDPIPTGFAYVPEAWA